MSKWRKGSSSLLWNPNKCRMSSRKSVFGKHHILLLGRDINEY